LLKEEDIGQNFQRAADFAKFVLYLIVLGDILEEVDDSKRQCILLNLFLAIKDLSLLVHCEELKSQTYGWLDEIGLENLD